MSITVKPICPLGSTCERIVNDEVHRCAWYTCLAGQHPQTGETINEWRCAMAWIPVMLVENANTNRGQTEALESFRNEAVQGQQVFNTLFANAARLARLEKEKGP